MQIEFRPSQNGGDVSLRPEKLADFHMISDLLSLIKCKEISAFKDNVLYISRNGIPPEGKLQEVIISIDTLSFVLAWATALLRKELEK